MTGVKQLRGTVIENRTGLEPATEWDLGEIIPGLYLQMRWELEGAE